MIDRINKNIDLLIGERYDNPFPLGSYSHFRFECKSKNFSKIPKDEKGAYYYMKKFEDEVVLFKPFRLVEGNRDYGNKKFGVYVDSGKKDEEGRVVAEWISWGDPNMEIRNDIPERSKSFLARHNCQIHLDRMEKGPTREDLREKKFWMCTVSDPQWGLLENNSPW